MSDSTWSPQGAGFYEMRNGETVLVEPGYGTVPWVGALRPGLAWGKSGECLIADGLQPDARTAFDLVAVRSICIRSPGWYADTLSGLHLIDSKDEGGWLAVKTRPTLRWDDRGVCRSTGRNRVEPQWNLARQFSVAVSGDGEYEDGAGNRRAVRRDGNLWTDGWQRWDDWGAVSGENRGWPDWFLRNLVRRIGDLPVPSPVGTATLVDGPGLYRDDDGNGRRIAGRDAEGWYASSAAGMRSTWRWDDDGTGTTAAPPRLVEKLHDDLFRRTTAAVVTAATLQELGEPAGPAGKSAPGNTLVATLETSGRIDFRKTVGRNGRETVSVELAFTAGEQRQRIRAEVSAAQFGQIVFGSGRLPCRVEVTTRSPVKSGGTEAKKGSDHHA